MSSPNSSISPASKEIADVAVIGAGGAGFLAAISAARSGARTVLFERMKTPAKKVVISGGGRCNFSNTLDARKFVRLFGDRNATKLGNALRALSNEDVIALLKEHGVEGQLEKNYRLYTKSGRGADVVAALNAELQKAGGSIELRARILNIKKFIAGDERSATAGARPPDEQSEKLPLPNFGGTSPEHSGGELFELTGTFNEIEGVRYARAVVISTGGLSYPVTGSTGDGYTWAREFGHRVTPLRAALVGLAASEPWTKSLQGLAWPDAQVALWPEAPLQGKPFCVERAEILFTHFGISGPAILDASNAYVASGIKNVPLTIDFFPEETREALDARLLERFKQFPNRTAARAMDGLMPVRMLEHFEAQLGGDAATSVCRFPKTARAKLLDGMKATRLTVTGTRGMEFGEVTAGGIEWDEIDAGTLESKRAPGLFFAGEILDLAGRCGGFNLQAAFSTGYLAGQNAAAKARG